MGNISFAGPPPFDFAVFVEYYDGARYAVIAALLAVLLVSGARRGRRGRRWLPS